MMSVVSAQLEELMVAPDLAVWGRSLWGRVEKEAVGFPEAAVFQRLGNVGIVGGYRSPGEQHSGFV